MKLHRYHRLHRAAVPGAPNPAVRPAAPGVAAYAAAPIRAAKAAMSPAAALAGVFAQLDVVQRARMLRQLLRPVGPMALTVLGGGAFAKFALQARWERISVTLDDAAAVTSAQVFELVRYVEQADPAGLAQLLTQLAGDATATTALGASIAAIALQQLARAAGRRRAPGSDTR